MQKLFPGLTIVVLLALAMVLLMPGHGLAQSTSTSDPVPFEQLTEDCPICSVETGRSDSVLTPAEIESLLLALNDEYHAYAVYGAVIDHFGPVRPFINIQRAEANHIRAVVRLMEIYDVPIPENPWLETEFSFGSVSEACAAGEAAELLNRDLYDQLFASTERSDLTQVFASLQGASEEKHLPAFQRCSATRP